MIVLLLTVSNRNVVVLLQQQTADSLQDFSLQNNFLQKVTPRWTKVCCFQHLVKQKIELPLPDDLLQLSHVQSQIWMLLFLKILLILEQLLSFESFHPICANESDGCRGVPQPSGGLKDIVWFFIPVYFELVLHEYFHFYFEELSSFGQDFL